MWTRDGRTPEARMPETWTGHDMSHVCSTTGANPFFWEDSHVRRF